MRPFRAWDGEGYDSEPVNGVTPHHLMLWGSLGGSITGESLQASECLDLLLDVERENPDDIHVIYSGNYDTVKILQSWPVEILEGLYKGNTLEHDGYSVSWMPGKMLRVSRHEISATLFDVFSYFGTSFVKACEQYLGKEDPRLVKVREGKQRRGKFGYADLFGEVVPYWQTELELLEQLADTLRTYLRRIGLESDRWHGPGSVANALNRVYGINRFQSDYERPDALQHALQCSYAGGRFEPFRVGRHEGKVFQYDRNSAYPYAATKLPNLRGGKWFRDQRPSEIDDFGVYKVTFDMSHSVHADFFERTPGPLFWRAKDSRIYFPTQVLEGWYRGPEILNLMEWFEPDCWEILDGWRFEPKDDVKPYGFVEGMYRKRLQYKREGNPTEYAVKIALNSIYGKMVQHTGWNEETRRVPQWHQLEWGSYITSEMRANLHNSMMTAHVQNPGSLIAVETDALFVTEPLSLPMSDDLGDWKQETYEEILYLQSGLYFTDGERGKAKTRGVEAGNITQEDALEYLRNIREGAELTSLLHRFAGVGQHAGKPTLGTWFDQTRHLGLAVNPSEGKRWHDDNRCDRCPGDFLNGTHSLRPSPAGHSPSYPYVLPWTATRDKENPFRQEELF